MLYLNPPFHIIEGVSLFSDHADPLQYYYLPMMPKLTTIVDQATGQQIPQIQLIKYRGKAGNGGFLNFDVNIGVEEVTLEKIRGKIKQTAGLDQTPRLAPVPLIDGTVRLLLFGKQTGDTANPNSTTPQFVLKIDQAAKPSLYGNNQAAFSVALDQYGVTVMEKALQGEMSPIGIVYSLDYLALRPAYSVRLSVDWDRVQKHLDEHFGIDAIFVSVDIDKSVDELIEKRAIVLEADTFVPEGEDESAVLGRRDQAVNEVREMILDAFFKPSIDPVKEEEDGWDKAANFADRVSHLGHNGGFSYKKTDYTRIDRKSINVNISERTTVKRSIYPQGHLSGLARSIKQQGLDLNRFVMSVDLDDAWFERRKLAVISRANFEEDSISSINVRLNYGNTPTNVLLESSAARTQVEWASIVANNAMQREVTAQYKVTFKGIDGNERPVAIESKQEVFDGDNLEINPREFYSIVHVPIVALSFPWDRYPQVEVHLKYTDEKNGIRMDDTFLLDQAHSDQTWKMFVRDPKQNQFQYKLIYRAADNRDVETTFADNDDERITIRDPRPNKRSLTVIPNLDWNLIERAFVDLIYNDFKNDVYAEQSFEFSKDDSVSKSLKVDLVNPDYRQVTYQVTLLFKGGRMLEIPPSVTNDRRIILRSDMRGHRIISVQPKKVDFANKRLYEMQVELRYEDEDAGLSFSDLVSFQAMNDRSTFEFDYADDQKSTYEYRVTYRYLNGLSRSSDWSPASLEVLMVPVA
ncbi:MAG: hypothetical protein LH702_36205 [Phormidesmis sp. CAN_BIN44]|nr:hypothetical protein [Phormidesmis sp. CAN_BIN44]